jgi:ferredoxin
VSEPLQVSIDTESCRGAGECVFRAPGTFALSAADRAVLREGSADEEAAVLDAARSCPHFAISVRRGGSQIV